MNVKRNKVLLLIQSVIMYPLYAIFAKPVLKQAIKQMKDDPELLDSMSGMLHHTKRLKELNETFCDRWPDAKRCKNR